MPGSSKKWMRRKRIIFYQQKRKNVTFAPSNLSVAQLVEQLTLNQWVTGSNPVGETEKTKHLRSHLCRCFVFLLFKAAAVHLRVMVSCRHGQIVHMGSIEGNNF